jgi:HAD superfamily hydrolase (TIGR01509 family)
MHHPLRAVLVDIDGTLIDSNDAHVRAWLWALARQGRELPYDALRPLIGKGGDKVLAELFGADAECLDSERLRRDRSDRFLTHELHALQPTRGARDLLQKLREAGLLVVAATSAQASETVALLRQAGLDDLVDHAADSGDAARTKPDPDIVQSALHMAGARPSEAVMLGDTPYDIEAAVRAGVPVVALRCGGWWNDDALAGAVVIEDDPAALLASFHSSAVDPAARRR